jgi:hypothetical protein
LFHRKKKDEQEVGLLQEKNKKTEAPIRDEDYQV